MVLEGLKLMIVGMASVMLFLLLVITSIELIKIFTRNFSINQEKLLLFSRKSNSIKYNSVPNFEVPIEVFAAAIANYESDNNTS